MEALLFRHYLLAGTLLPLPEAQSWLPEGIELTAGDWVLGVFDFVGEVMRWGITMVALKGREEEGEGVVRGILGFMREVRGELEGLVQGGDGGVGVLGREVEKKVAVMRECVGKVEGAMCGVVVRGSEMPEGWVPSLEEERREE